MLHTVVVDLVAQAPGIPDPGGPLAPPGSQGVLKILRWVLWIAFACCVGGAAVIAGKIAMEHHQGMGGGQAVTQLWKPLAGVIVLSNVTGILAAVVTFG